VPTRGQKDRRKGGNSKGKKEKTTGPACKRGLENQKEKKWASCAWRDGVKTGRNQEKNLGGQFTTKGGGGKAKKSARDTAETRENL